MASACLKIYNERILPALQKNLNFSEYIPLDKITAFFSDLLQILKHVRARNFGAAQKLIKAHHAVLVILLGVSLKYLLETFAGSVGKWIWIKLEFCFQIYQCAAWIGLLLHFANQCIDLWSINKEIGSLRSELKRDEEEFNECKKKISANLEKLKAIFAEVEASKNVLVNEFQRRKYQKENRRFLNLLSEATSIYDETIKEIDGVLAKACSLEMRTQGTIDRCRGIQQLSAGVVVVGVVAAFFCPWIGAIAVATNVFTFGAATALKWDAQEVLARIGEHKAQIQALKTDITQINGAIHGLAQEVEKEFMGRKENSKLADIKAGKV